MTSAAGGNARGADGARLRIGVDASCLGSRRGYGRHLRELLPRLLERDPGTEYVLLVDDKTAAEEVGALPARVVRPRTSASQTARARRSLRDLFTMGRAAARERLDLMYFPSVYSYFPVPRRLPVVVGFHDAIPERHGAIVFPSRAARLAWRAKVAHARRRARAVITVSDWSRAALVEALGIPADRVFVTIEAPSPEFQPPAAGGEPWRGALRARGLPGDARYFIYVGGFNPHKNLERLVDAFAQPARERGLHLLLVGDYSGDPFHADVAALRARIAQHGVGERVHLVGFVPDSELRGLYAGALALVLPSLEEGFGLPAVEAAACGTACVATDRSPLPQILEDGGLFVDPRDTGALRDALVRLADGAELRASLARGALARARKLTWEDTAEATHAVLVAAAGRRP